MAFIILGIYRNMGAEQSKAAAEAAHNVRKLRTEPKGPGGVLQPQRWRGHPTIANSHNTSRSHGTTASSIDFKRLVFLTGGDVSFDRRTGKIRNNSVKHVNGNATLAKILIRDPRKREAIIDQITKNNVSNEEDATKNAFILLRNITGPTMGPNESFTPGEISTLKSIPVDNQYIAGALFNLKRDFPEQFQGENNFNFQPYNPAFENNRGDGKDNFLIFAAKLVGLNNNKFCTTYSHVCHDGLASTRQNSRGSSRSAEWRPAAAAHERSEAAAIHAALGPHPGRAAASGSAAAPPQAAAAEEAHPEVAALAAARAENMRVATAVNTLSNLKNDINPEIHTIIKNFETKKDNDLEYLTNLLRDKRVILDSFTTNTTTNLKVVKEKERASIYYKILEGLVNIEKSNGPARIDAIKQMDPILDEYEKNTMKYYGKITDTQIQYITMIKKYLEDKYNAKARSPELNLLGFNKFPLLSASQEAEGVRPSLSGYQHIPSPSPSPKLNLLGFNNHPLLSASQQEAGRVQPTLSGYEGFGGSRKKRRHKKRKIERTRRRHKKHGR